MGFTRVLMPPKQWLKTARNPPRYLTASLIVALGGLLNGYVASRSILSIVDRKPSLERGIFFSLCVS